MAMLFADSVRRVTISEEKVQWAKHALAESESSHVIARKQKMSALLTQKTKLKNRLSKLYDLRIDGGIDNDGFSYKKVDYETQLTEIDSAIKQNQNANPNFLEDGCKTPTSVTGSSFKYPNTYH